MAAKNKLNILINKIKIYTSGLILYILILLTAILGAYIFNKYIDPNTNSNNNSSVNVNINSDSNKKYKVKLVQELYEVKPNDTLRSIGKKFIKKNTYGDRNLLEFTQGIYELNYHIFKKEGGLKPGQIIRINYFIKNYDI